MSDLKELADDWSEPELSGCESESCVSKCRSSANLGSGHASVGAGECSIKLEDARCKSLKVESCFRSNEADNCTVSSGDDCATHSSVLVGCNDVGTVSQQSNVGVHCSVQSDRRDIADNFSSTDKEDPGCQALVERPANEEEIFGELPPTAELASEKRQRCLITAQNDGISGNCYTTEEQVTLVDQTHQKPRISDAQTSNSHTAESLTAFCRKFSAKSAKHSVVSSNISDGMGGSGVDSLVVEELGHCWPDGVSSCSAEAEKLARDEFVVSSTTTSSPGGKQANYQETTVKGARSSDSAEVKQLTCDIDCDSSPQGPSPKKVRHNPDVAMNDTSLVAGNAWPSESDGPCTSVASSCKEVHVSRDATNVPPTPSSSSSPRASSLSSRQDCRTDVAADSLPTSTGEDQISTVSCSTDPSVVNTSADDSSGRRMRQTTISASKASYMDSVQLAQMRSTGKCVSPTRKHTTAASRSPCGDTSEVVAKCSASEVEQPSCAEQDITFFDRFSALEQTAFASWMTRKKNLDVVLARFSVDASVLRSMRSAATRAQIKAFLARRAELKAAQVGSSPRRRKTPSKSQQTSLVPAQPPTTSDRIERVQTIRQAVELVFRTEMSATQLERVHPVSRRTARTIVTMRRQGCSVRRVLEWCVCAEVCRSDRVSMDAALRLVVSSKKGTQAMASRFGLNVHVLARRAEEAKFLLGRDISRSVARTAALSAGSLSQDEDQPVGVARAGSATDCGLDQHEDHTSPGASCVERLGLSIKQEQHHDNCENINCDLVNARDGTDQTSSAGGGILRVRRFSTSSWDAVGQASDESAMSGTNCYTTSTAASATHRSGKTMLIKKRGACSASTSSRVRHRSKVSAHHSLPSKKSSASHATAASAKHGRQTTIDGVSGRVVVSTHSGGVSPSRHDCSSTPGRSSGRLVKPSHRAVAALVSNSTTSTMWKMFSRRLVPAKTNRPTGGGGGALHDAVKTVHRSTHNVAGEAGGRQKHTRRRPSSAQLAARAERAAVAARDCRVQGISSSEAIARHDVTRGELRRAQRAVRRLPDVRQLLGRLHRHLSAVTDMINGHSFEDVCAKHSISQMALLSTLQQLRQSGLVSPYFGRRRLVYGRDDNGTCGGGGNTQDSNKSATLRSPTTTEHSTGSAPCHHGDIVDPPRVTDALSDGKTGAAASNVRLSSRASCSQQADVGARQETNSSSSVADAPDQTDTTTVSLFERRIQRALAAKRSGLSYSQVKKLFGVSSVSLWRYVKRQQMGLVASTSGGDGGALSRLPSTTLAARPSTNLPASQSPTSVGVVPADRRTDTVFPTSRANSTAVSEAVTLVLDEGVSARTAARQCGVSYLTLTYFIKRRRDGLPLFRRCLEAVSASSSDVEVAPVSDGAARRLAAAAAAWRGGRLPAREAARQHDVPPASVIVTAWRQVRQKRVPSAAAAAGTHSSSTETRQLEQLHRFLRRISAVDQQSSVRRGVLESAAARACRLPMSLVRYLVHAQSSDFEVIYEAQAAVTGGIEQSADEHALLSQQQSQPAVVPSAAVPEGASVARRPRLAVDLGNSAACQSRARGVRVLDVISPQVMPSMSVCGGRYHPPPPLPSSQQEAGAGAAPYKQGQADSSLHKTVNLTPQKRPTSLPFDTSPVKKSPALAVVSEHCDVSGGAICVANSDNSSSAVVPPGSGVERTPELRLRQAVENVLLTGQSIDVAVALFGQATASGDGEDATKPQPSSSVENFRCALQRELDFGVGKPGRQAPRICDELFVVQCTLTLISSGWDVNFTSLVWMFNRFLNRTGRSCEKGHSWLDLASLARRWPQLHGAICAERGKPNADFREAFDKALSVMLGRYKVISGHRPLCPPGSGKILSSSRRSFIRQRRVTTADTGAREGVTEEAAAPVLPSCSSSSSVSPSGEVESELCGGSSSASRPVTPSPTEVSAVDSTPAEQNCAESARSPATPPSNSKQTDDAVPVDDSMSTDVISTNVSARASDDSSKSLSPHQDDVFFSGKFCLTPSPATSPTETKPCQSPSKKSADSACNISVSQPEQTARQCDDSPIQLVQSEQPEVQQSEVHALLPDVVSPQHVTSELPPHETISSQHHALSDTSPGDSNKTETQDDASSAKSNFSHEEDSSVSAMCDNSAISLTEDTVNDNIKDVIAEHSTTNALSAESCADTKPLAAAATSPTETADSVKNVQPASVGTAANDTETNDAVYEVEAILASRKNFNLHKTEFLIRWKGYTDEHNSWEPSENLNCHDLLVLFKNGWRNLSKKRRRLIVDHYCRTDKTDNFDANDANQQTLDLEAAIVSFSQLSPKEANSAAVSESSADNAGTSWRRLSSNDVSQTDDIVTSSTVTDQSEPVLAVTSPITDQSESTSISVRHRSAVTTSSSIERSSRSTKKRANALFKQWLVRRSPKRPTATVVKQAASDQASPAPVREAGSLDEQQTPPMSLAREPSPPPETSASDSAADRREQQHLLPTQHELDKLDVADPVAVMFEDLDDDEEVADSLADDDCLSPLKSLEWRPSLLMDEGGRQVVAGGRGRGGRSGSSRVVHLPDTGGNEAVTSDHVAVKPPVLPSSLTRPFKTVKRGRGATRGHTTRGRVLFSSKAHRGLARGGGKHFHGLGHAASTPPASESASPRAPDTAHSDSTAQSSAVAGQTLGKRVKKLPARLLDSEIFDVSLAADNNNVVDFESLTILPDDHEDGVDKRTQQKPPDHLSTDASAGDDISSFQFVGATDVSFGGDGMLNDQCSPVKSAHKHGGGRRMKVAVKPFSQSSAQLASHVQPIHNEDELHQLSDTAGITLLSDDASVVVLDHGPLVINEQGDLVPANTHSSSSQQSSNSASPAVCVPSSKLGAGKWTKKAAAAVVVKNAKKKWALKKAASINAAQAGAITSQMVASGSLARVIIPKKRGRPRKYPLPDTPAPTPLGVVDPGVKPMVKKQPAAVMVNVAKKRGRPRKNPLPHQGVGNVSTPAASRETSGNGAAAADLCVQNNYVVSSSPSDEPPEEVTVDLSSLLAGDAHAVDTSVLSLHESADSSHLLAAQEDDECVDDEVGYFDVNGQFIERSPAKPPSCVQPPPTLVLNWTDSSGEQVPLSSADLQPDVLSAAQEGIILLMSDKQNNQ